MTFIFRHYKKTVVLREKLQFVMKSLKIKSVLHPSILAFLKCLTEKSYLFQRFMLRNRDGNLVLIFVRPRVRPNKKYSKFFVQLPQFLRSSF